jgi:aspartyl-tRNA(Asn)/glutamyl-tRNA(Gln) amidotransferase subunit A
MDSDDLAFASATYLASGIRAGRISPREVVDALLNRIDAINPTVNAFCTVAGEQARRDAESAEAAVSAGDPLGALHGVPVSIKDVVFTKGVRTTRGSAIYADLIPDQDAPLVERLKRAGAIVFGKTNTPEFGWKAVTDNLLFGQTPNPWDLDRTAGGSSGGSAAALAAGLGPLSIGTDGAGSIRIPASFCGVVGLKPSFGRVPFYPFSAAESVAHAGPMARTVADTALLLSVIAGPDVRDPNTLPDTDEDFAAAATGESKGLRVAWSEDLGFARVDPEVRDRFVSAVHRFADDLGCHVEEASPGFADPYEALERIFHGGIAASLVDYLPEWRDRIDPGLIGVFDRVGTLSAFDLARAGFARRAVWEQSRAFFERFDILLTPTMPIPAFTLGTDSPLDASGEPTRILAWTPFTYPWNLTGHPAISVPCGFTDAGLPVGLQIVGRRWDDLTVLQAAAAYEHVALWQDRRPVYRYDQARTTDSALL